MAEREESRKQIIASRIREARKMAGLSQGQVARILGLHRPSISQVEAGQRNVSAEELSRLAEIYDVALSWLAGEDAERLDAQDDRIQLAARQLSKLKPQEMDRLFSLLASMHEREGQG